MKHIFEWLEEDSKTIEETKVREFLDFKTRPALYQMRNQKPTFRVFCEYENKKYLITGASRMGDVWLAENFKRENGYDKRVDIEECCNFSYKENEAQDE